jgi:dolichol-phosphate mannosyltransferase
MGIDMIVSFSYSPIRLMLYTGLLAAVGSAVFGAVLLVERFLLGAAVEGWRVLTWAVLFFGALNLTMLGILGEYVWRVLEQVRERPLYIIEETIGLDSDLPAAGMREGRPAGHIHG